MDRRTLLKQSMAATAAGVVAWHSTAENAPAADAGKHTAACDEPYAHMNIYELIQFYAKYGKVSKKRQPRLTSRCPFADACRKHRR
jgi:hypothetical protein